MNNKLIIESLSMDLFRVAIGYQRKSLRMGERFSQEALLRISEVKKSSLKPYFNKILRQITRTLSEEDIDRKAENALMYSTICKNYSQKYL